MRRFLLLLALFLPSCGEAVDDNHFADDIHQERTKSPPVTTEAVAVRIGELGPNFPACNAAGTPRNVEAGAALGVRTAPFDTAKESGRIPAGQRFFVCTRSHDQKWFGIVYAEGDKAQTCGVSSPIASRRAYDGPCKSGWVSSPFVKLTAQTIPAQQVDSTTENAL
ncbi:MAG: hypothetical protein H0W74_10990 [Sphingosinicella sp.]|nr:hypothetical protein [Sphingosinicella sp.]